MRSVEPSTWLSVVRNLDDVIKEMSAHRDFGKVGLKADELSQRLIESDVKSLPDLSKLSTLSEAQLRGGLLGSDSNSANDKLEHWRISQPVYVAQWPVAQVTLGSCRSGRYLTRRRVMPTY